MDKSNDNKTCKVEQGLLNGAKGGVAPTLTACYGKCRSYTNAYGKHRYPFVIERYEWKQ